MLLLIKPNNKALGSIFMTVCLGGVYQLCSTTYLYAECQVKNMNIVRISSVIGLSALSKELRYVGTETFAKEPK